MNRYKVPKHLPNKEDTVGCCNVFVVVRDVLNVYTAFQARASVCVHERKKILLFVFLQKKVNYTNNIHIWNCLKHKPPPQDLEQAETPEIFQANRRLTLFRYVWVGRASSLWVTEFIGGSNLRGSKPIVLGGFEGRFKNGGAICSIDVVSGIAYPYFMPRFCCWFTIYKIIKFIKHKSRNYI